MHIARRTTLVLAFCVAKVNGVAGQGVTTGGIRGTVRDSLGAPIAARVRVSHDSTGVSLEPNAAGGRFRALGLEAGGPYTVTVRALGYRPQQRRVEYVGAGTIQDVDFALQRLASDLDTVFVETRAGSEPATRADGGAGTTLGAALLEGVPASNRDLHDFVPLVPQISSKISLSSPGLSAAGTGFRYNNFSVNGVSERTLSGGVSTAFAGNRSVPLDAVQEYQVMLSPFDVRFGDFTGAFVNAVTKSGTNTFHASAFGYGRNDRLARHVDVDSTASYERAQYGLVLSGPIVRDRVHFLIASEVQSFTYPAIGPAIDASGRNSSAAPPPIAAADLDRFSAIMSRYGLVAGDAGAVRNGNPLRNLFTRVDVALPSWNSRLAVWNNYTGSENEQFSRASRDTFSLSSYQVTRFAQTRMTAAHLHTILSGVAYNELLVSARSEGGDVVGAVEQPIVRVAVVSPMTGGSVTLNSGTHESAQGNVAPPNSSFDVKDNVTLTLNATHALTVGAEAERFRVSRGGVTNTLGVWNFASLDDFAAGRAARYDVGIDFGNATATLAGSHYAAYASDRWQASDHLAVTAGLRGNQLVFDSRPAYNQAVDSVLGIRTDRMPGPRIELSPRVGFTWDLSSSRHDRLSGGLGTFTGRYPLAWVQSAQVANGQGNRQLTCTVLGSAANYPPPFSASPVPPPSTCAGGAPATPNLHGDLDLVDPNLRPLRSLRASLAFARDAFGGAVLTSEALITHGLSDVAVRNLNLPSPRGRDPYGRVIYDSIAPNGLVRAARQPDFSEAIDVVNAPGARSYQLSTRIERAPSLGIGGSLSYTFSQARDVMTPLRVNARGTVLWASARVVSGSHDDFTRTTSSNDIPHRVIAVGTYTRSWFRSPTNFSFSYIGEAGRPFTYIAYGAGGKGDLNGDGSNSNDPIYIPRNALDSAEIRVTGVSDAAGADNSATTVSARESTQRQALQRFIDDTPCLRRQRGRIMERNSCREPWSNTTVASLKQELPVGGRALDLELDVFNVLNLLNAAWGSQREAAPALLEQVQQTSAPVLGSRPVFRYDTTRPTWTVVTDESKFQLQLAARYRF